MLQPKTYLDQLLEMGVSFFAGVPDSLLKNFCACVDDSLKSNSHIIAANEGSAVGLGIGHHLGTGAIPMVYMQNSGLGNSVNPLLSLASPEVYGIPMLLLIGWRGEPGVKDEPQHVHQGRVMLEMLDVMDIEYFILDSDPLEAKRQTSVALESARKGSRPVALIARKNLFDKYQVEKPSSSYKLTREEAIIAAAEAIGENSVIVSTTGMASRELYEYRASNNLGHETDFLTVGGMGHAAQIALGIALSNKTKNVYCFDGDGAALMHMGAMPTIGQSNCSNLVHLVLNNGAHGSVGGQPTVGFDISFCDIAKSCGYHSQWQVEDASTLKTVLQDTSDDKGVTFVEIRTSSQNRDGIGRPKSSPEENKYSLMQYMEV